MPTRPFIHEDFLLGTRQARELYHRYAADEPIYDYHCHLPPDQIASNHAFADLAELWLGGDHYKWRAMRTNGVKEHFITGKATSREKFQAWAETVPHTLRNPLHHWSALAEPCTHAQARTPRRRSTPGARWRCWRRPTGSGRATPGSCSGWRGSTRT